MKAYVTPAPPMVLASTRGRPGVMARIGRTSLSLVEVPERIAPRHGGWGRLPAAHPARHGLADAEFLRHIGLWWGALLTGLREHTAAR